MPKFYYLVCAGVFWMLLDWWMFFQLVPDGDWYVVYLLAAILFSVCYVIYIFASNRKQINLHFYGEEIVSRFEISHIKIGFAVIIQCFLLPIFVMVWLLGFSAPNIYTLFLGSWEVREAVVTEKRDQVKGRINRHGGRSNQYRVVYLNIDGGKHRIDNTTRENYAKLSVGSKVTIGGQASVFGFVPFNPKLRIVE